MSATIYWIIAGSLVGVGLVTPITLFWHGERLGAFLIAMMLLLVTPPLLMAMRALAKE